MWAHENAGARARANLKFKKKCAEKGVLPYYVPVGGFMLTPRYDDDPAALEGAVKDLASLKLRKRDLDERHRGLQHKHEALVARNSQLEAEARASAEEAAAARRGMAMEKAEAARRADADALAGKSQLGAHLGCFRCVLVCLPAAAQHQPLAESCLRLRGLNGWSSKQTTFGPGCHRLWTH